MPALAQALVLVRDVIDDDDVSSRTGEARRRHEEILRTRDVVEHARDHDQIGAGLRQVRDLLDDARVLNGSLMSINLMFAIDEYRIDNGATQFLLGSHQQTTPPDVEALRSTAVQGVCPAGSMILFDSTLYHAAGTNTSDSDRVAVNHGFVRPWVKQHIDAVHRTDHGAPQVGVQFVRTLQHIQKGLRRR